MQMVNAMLKDVGRPPSRRKPGPAPLFNGVKRADWRARPNRARALSAALAQRGEVAYWALPEVVPAAEERSGARDRTRLRSGKLPDPACRFVSGRRFCDRWVSGLRLVLARNISLPWRAAVHIDEICEAPGVR